LDQEITYSVLIGGQKESKLENNSMIIIGTLGRMKKLFKNNIKKFRNFVNVKVLVIDEADKMLSQNDNNNFENFLKMFLNKENSQLKTILVTASFDEKAKLFYLNYLKNLLVIKSEDCISDLEPKIEKIENNTIITSKPKTINSLTITNIKEYYFIFISPNKTTYYEEKYAKLFEIIQASKGKFKQALIFYNHKGRGEELSGDFRYK
jgi:superfamily II DNA/RNA helicase